MEIGRVVGIAVSTAKSPSMTGVRLMVVETGDGTREIVADTVNAGVGSEVMFSRGTAARIAVGDPNSTVDAAITGILDDMTAPPRAAGRRR